MPVFDEILLKIVDISNKCTKNINDDFQAALDRLDEYGKLILNEPSKGRETSRKIKNPVTNLQSINEDEAETPGIQAEKPKSNGRIHSGNSSPSISESNVDKSIKLVKKRSKNEVDDIVSPEVDKRQKRNASVKAQSIISKQVNTNLNQKLRRETSTDKVQSSRNRRLKDNDKENSEPIALAQVKQEKLSVLLEPMDTECLPVGIEIKQEAYKDIMPPPMAPVPNRRKNTQKVNNDEDNPEHRRSTRTRKPTYKAENMPPPPVPAPRATRSSARLKIVDAEENVTIEETRPKRTRTKKMPARQDAVENPSSDAEKDTPSSGAASPMEKPKPKRTKRAQKAAEKLVEKEAESEIIDEPKQVQKSPETIIRNGELKQPRIFISPLLYSREPNETKRAENILQSDGTKSKLDKQNSAEDRLKSKKIVHDNLDGVVQENEKIPEDSAPVISKSTESDKSTVVLNQELNATITIISNMDKTVVLPNGLYNHDPNTPKDFHVNETVVLETNNSETVSGKTKIMDTTVVLEKDPIAAMITEDSLMTDDNSDVYDQTPPKKEIPIPQPTSAVKEKVQQFEEMAVRVTRTKTRALAKKAEQTDNETPPNNQTPLDKVSRPLLSAETLSKMNNLIFNEKIPQVSSSASKVFANTVSVMKTSSTSMINNTNKQKDAIVKEIVRSANDDARKKKEAILQSKREDQKRKREVKMAAAAAAREAAEKERRAALEAAVRERQEKQAHVDRGKLDRLKEVERKKQELARKVAETEERRRAEEQARQRLLEEQRRAEALRKKQQEEAEAARKEDAMMAKEMEKKQKEYLEKRKLKQKMESMKGYNHSTQNGAKLPLPPMEPTYMADGFQYLDSGSDEESPVSRPIPSWSTNKARREQLIYQMKAKQTLVDHLFSVRVHSVDLLEIFPNINRNMLKRTSSAVWRTPPQRLPTLQESPA